MDTRDDVLLVLRGDTRHSPYLSIGRVDNSTILTTTTTVATTTTTPTPTTSSTLDPCEHLLQELEIQGEDNNHTIVDLANLTTTTTVVPTTTTEDPLQIPLPLARVEFQHITDPVEFYHEASFKRYRHPAYNCSTEDTFFTSWYAKPEDSDKDIPLLVYVRGGPHSIKTQVKFKKVYDQSANAYLFV